MYCLRCGKDTPEKQVFCNSCLDSMDKYPIKPGTSVHLPRKKEAPPAKKAARKFRPVTPEELIVRMRKAIRILALMLAVSLLLLCVAIGMLLQHWQEAPAAPIGQNYTVSTKN